MATATHQVAEYKGRKYRLLWAGATQYGRRAKLGFFYGSKEFWVDESAITVLPPSSGRSSGNVCAECGRAGELVADLEDGALKHYNCCDIPPG